MKAVKAVRYLANLGYGTRHDVTQLFASGRVTRTDGRRLDADDEITHDEALIDGAPLDPAPGVVIMLNKPVGFICSTSDSGRLVYELLPSRFARRSPALAPVGRLDRDTSGLLLLTDDGPLNHRLTSPKTHLPKVYEATLAHPLRGDEAAAVASGSMILRGDDTPLRPAQLEQVSLQRARVTLTEGRYHQVRRMFAALGNHVDTLHRSAIGGLTLGALGEGEWRVLGPEQLESLRDA